MANAAVGDARLRQLQRSPLIEQQERKIRFANPAAFVARRSALRPQTPPRATSRSLDSPGDVPDYISNI